jgi:hypothetical protein
MAKPLDTSVTAAASLVETVKQLLAEPKDRIKLDDYVTGLLKHVLDVIARDSFWAELGNQNAENIQARLRAYENTMRDLCNAVVLLVRWGRNDVLLLLRRIVTRLAEPPSNLTAWYSMQWYPLSLILYCAGMAGLYADNYSALQAMFFAQTTAPHGERRLVSVAVRAADEMNQLSDAFKLLPAHARNHVPRSEYYFELLRHSLDDLLFLGGGYERLFDRFEILNALFYADQTATPHRVWAAPGRFGWKHLRGDSPYSALVKEADDAGDHWPPLKAGFFQCSRQRFQDIAKAYGETLSRMNFY